MSENESLAKTANECAEKLRGMEALIPPPEAKPTLIRVQLEKLPAQSFTVHHSHPVDDTMLIAFEVICGAAGLVMLGIVIAVGVFR